MTSVVAVCLGTRDEADKVRCLQLKDGTYVALAQGEEVTWLQLKSGPVLVQSATRARDYFEKSGVIFRYTTAECWEGVHELEIVTPEEWDDLYTGKVCCYDSDVTTTESEDSSDAD